MSITIRQRKWSNKGRKKIGSAWQVDIGFQTPEGAQIRKRFNFEGTKFDASEWGERVRDALRSGMPVPPQHVAEKEASRTETFARFAEEFLKTHTVDNKASQKRSKEIIVHRHLIPFFGEMALDKIDERLVDGFTHQLIEVKKLTRKTAHNIRTVLKTILRKAVEYGVLKAAPRIKRLKVETPDIHYFGPEQAGQLLQAIDPKWRTMLLVALRTGLRLGELRGLRWVDVDFFGRKLHVKQSYAREVLGTPKSGRLRTVDLSSDAWEGLRSHKKGACGELVFCNPDGSHLAHNSCYPALHQACAVVKIGDESWTPGWHTCRHTFVSWLVQAGVPLNVVQKLAGHADIQMTLRYAHLAPSATRDAVARLDVVTKALSQGSVGSSQNAGNEG